MRRLYWFSAAATAACAGSLVVPVACTTSDSAGTPAEGQEASVPEASTPTDAGTNTVAADAADASSLCPPLPNDTPRDLGCTGLYASLAAKQISTAVREYTPAVALWSDGADKSRWIYLPPGATIDDTNPAEWKFPVGTKLWKEFRVGGHRVETRLFQKLGDNFWVHASYQWAVDELSATRADGADFTTLDGNPYHIPTPSECDKCHNGRLDRVLGFDAISLGLAGAAGVTLDALAKQGLLAPAPPATSYVIDDGTGKAARALAWLNVNCGITCHNDNTTATAYPTLMRLRLDPAQLDGGAPGAGWEALDTTLGVAAFTPKWAGSTRIVPGDPDKSLLVRLISERGTEQMPPIDSFVVDDPGVKLVRDWIASMPPLDGGASDGGADGGHDGGS